MAEAHIALLRGVNLGGYKKLAMKDLAALFANAGCSNVRTYIQSGNVVFEAPGRLAAKIPGRIAAGIEKQFGFETTVILRTATEWRACAGNNPFLAGGVPEEQLALMCLAAVPTAEQVASLDPKRSAPDRFVVLGRDIYMHCPNGLGKSKLTNAYFDARLKTVSTCRNWRTVGMLLAMASAK